MGRRQGRPTLDDQRPPPIVIPMALSFRPTTLFGPKAGPPTDLPLAETTVIRTMTPPPDTVDQGAMTTRIGEPTDGHPPDKESFPDEGDGELGSFSGVHDVQKTVDHWFEREVHEIEKEADRYAVAWAQENLPTLTDDTQNVLPPEAVLMKRAGELWQRWPERIQVKMQDAIDAGAAELRGCISAARAAIAETKLVRAQLRDAESKIEDIRAEMARTQGPVRYGRFLSLPSTILLSVLLVVVEFIANQPVFRLIWPMQPELASTLSESANRVAAQGGLLSGARIALVQTLGFFEASVLAFAVVILLFVLAKSLGTALRPLVALKPDDYPFASRSIKSLHRQKALAGIFCLAGTIAVVSFLFAARQGASGLVQGRLDVASRQLGGIQAHADSLERTGEPVPSTLAMALGAAQAEVERLTHDRDFAVTVKAENGSILVLNVSLVCFALVVGFMGAARDISDTMGEHPDLPRLKEKCSRLAEQLIRHAVVAREQVTRGELAIGRVNSLLRSRPLATLDAKRQRLESIIPRWRAANAQLRGIQPESITAFRRSAAVDLPIIPSNIVLTRPEGFEGAATVLEEISAVLYGVERETDVPHLAVA
jgi:hypothetical protein